MFSHLRRYRPDAPNCYSILTFLATFTIAQGAVIIGLSQFPDSKGFATVVYTVLFLITLAAVFQIVTLHEGNEHYFDKASIHLAVGVAIVSLLI